MKIAYFDCFNGISGDMLLGTLIDAGLDLEELKTELKKLNIGKFDISTEKMTKKTITGTKVNVTFSGQEKERHLSDIEKIIDSSSLENQTKKMAKSIFLKLAQAEAEVHGKSIDKIHFHEVGAMDSIIDIIGTVIGLQKLRIERIYSSKIPIAHGIVKCEHGTLPNPAPGTVNCLKGVPTYPIDSDKELVTPTGAAIISTITKEFGFPEMKIEKIGYGAGSFDTKQPNLLRVYIGTTEQGEKSHTVELIETNIDDMNPEFFDYIYEKLFEKGAMDVHLTNILMKKNRPGIKLTVLSPIEKTSELVEVIFNETTTLGVKITKARKIELQREEKNIETSYGKIRVKIAKLNGKVTNVKPEYEDCKRVAKEKNISLKEAYHKIFSEVNGKIKTQ